MPQTLNNGITVPINSDAWNLVTDLATMGNTARVITYVADVAARDAVTPLVAGRIFYVASENRFHEWTGSEWALHNGRERSGDIATFSTGWTALTGAHKPRIFMNGSTVFSFGAVQSSASSGLNICTVPSWCQPPNANTRFIGSAMTSQSQSVELTLSNGIINIPSGYGSINVATPQVVPIVGQWVMD